MPLHLGNGQEVASSTMAPKSKKGTFWIALILFVLKMMHIPDGLELPRMEQGHSKGRVNGQEEIKQKNLSYVGLFYVMLFFLKLFFGF